MTIRGIIRNGMIETDGELPDGTEVRIVPVKPRGTKSARAGQPAVKTAPRKKRVAAARKRGDSKSNPLLPLFGIWKDRPEWKGLTTLEIHKLLRAKSMGKPIDPATLRGRARD
jgi:hypothetical protein